MLQAVLFDLDGTLLDTEPDFTIILNQMLVDHGQAVVTAANVRKFVSAGATTLVSQGFGMPVDDLRLPDLLAEFLQRYAHQIKSTQAILFADIDALLNSLNERGAQWGIMTNKARRFSKPLVTFFEEFSTCATLVCPDDVGISKPDPAGLLLACKQLGVTPAHTCYVGDHPRDIEAAINAGMPGIAVSWGYLPDDKPIEQWGASIISRTPLDLINQLASQLNNSKK